MLLNEPVLGLLGGLVGAVLTFFGVRLIARQSHRAAEATAAVSSRQVEAGEWQAIVEALRSEVARLPTRVERLENERETKDARYETLLQYTRELMAWGRRASPAELLPAPPSVFVDELTYITER